MSIATKPTFDSPGALNRHLTPAWNGIGHAISVHASPLQRCRRLASLSALFRQAADANIKHMNTLAATPDASERLRLRMIALSRWENEGGTVNGNAQPAPPLGGDAVHEPAADDAETVQLRVRVIALENLVIALLAQAPENHLELVREMAAYISPRPGYTPHQLTLRAADEMRSLVDRAVCFRTTPQD